MHGSLDRANRLAWRFLAMHARHRLETAAGRRAALVTVDAEPVHDAAFLDFLGANHRHVVLGLAGDHAGVAADAGGVVDDHCPGGCLFPHLR